jgi:hypothetical protein
LTANSYSVTVTDVNGCISAAVVATINQPSVLLAPLNGTNVSCFGECTAGISPTVSGGTPPYAYQWSNGVTSWNTQNISNLCAGTYQLNILDANNCPLLVSYTVTQPPSALAVTVVSVDDVSCFGDNDGQVIIAINGGTAIYTATLDGQSITVDPFVINTATFLNLGPGTFLLSVTDANGCNHTESITIISPPDLTLSVVPTNILCAGQNTGELLITANGGEPSLSYVITGPTPSSGLYPPPANPVTSLAAGTYGVTVTDVNGCSITVSSNITVPNPIQIVAIPIPVDCYSLSTGQIIPTVSGGAGGYSYSWVASNGGVLTSGASAASQINIPAGTYVLTVTDINLCSLSQTYVVTEPPSPLSASIVQPITNVNCANAGNGQITISISGGTPTYTVNGGPPVIGNSWLSRTAKSTNYGASTAYARNFIH